MQLKHSKRFILTSSKKKIRVKKKSQREVSLCMVVEGVFNKGAARKAIQAYSHYPNRRGDGNRRGGVPVHHFSIERGVLIEGRGAPRCNRKGEKG